MALSTTAQESNLRGMNCLAHGDCAGAVAAFDRAISLADSADAALLYYNRGTARHLLNDFRGAQTDFDQALAIKPHFAEAHNNRGMSRQSAGDLAGAREDFQQAIILKNEYVEAYNNRGIARRLLGDLAGALADFDRAIALDSNYAEAHNNRGVVQQSLGNLEGAIADFNHAIAMNPRYAQAYCNRGIARQGLAERVRPTRARPFGDHAGASPVRGDLAEALADFDRAVELSPRNGAALIYHNRGAARQAQGDLAGALRDYDEALAIDGAHGATYANRGTARKAIGDLEGARADLDRALELTPPANAAAVYHNRGGVRVLQNDFAGAIADYDEALRLDPHLLVAWLSRGNARYHQRDPRAFMDHRHAIAVQPDFAVPEIIAMVADDLRRDEPGVLRNCEKHLRINRQDVTAYFRRGLSRLLLGQEVEGEEDLESIRQLQPDLERELGLLGAEAKRRRIR